MLKLKNIRKTFNKNSQDIQIALNDITLNVKKGDFVSVIGSNGAGKSSLFNAICGSFEIDEGSIILDNTNITFMPEHKRAKLIGRLFQDPLRGTAPEMSILENLYLACSSHDSWLHRITDKEKRFIKEKVAMLGMGLENRMNQAVGLLSGGQRQALTLAMAIIITPKILLLDEHTAALDPPTAEKIMNLTNKIVKENELTCLMITHNMNYAIDYGNRLLMMHEGQIILDLDENQKKETSASSIINEFKNIIASDRILTTLR